MAEYLSFMAMYLADRALGTDRRVVVKLSVLVEDVSILSCSLQ